MVYELLVWGLNWLWWVYIKKYRATSTFSTEVRLFFYGIKKSSKGFTFSKVHTFFFTKGIIFIPATGFSFHDCFKTSGAKRNKAFRRMRHAI